MIIYGSKAVHLKSAPSKTTTCPSCGTQGSIIFSIYRKHAHIFWIPLFPIGKVGASHCQHCKSTLEAKEMPNAFRIEYENLKSEAKGPLWQFTGLGLILCLIIFIGYAGSENKKMELQYITNPMKGDVYTFKTETKGYSTLKVFDIAQDSVFVSPNNYEINKSSKIHQIDKPENYAESTFGIAKSQLVEMYNSSHITDVDRH